MALLGSAHGLDLVSMEDRGPYCRVSSGDLLTLGLDVAGVIDRWAFVGLEGEGGGPPGSGVLSRFYPPLPAERVFPPLPAERVFPL